MLDFDTVSIQFDIPAHDHLGLNHVEGKVRFMSEKVEIDWRVKGNVFRGGNAPVKTITLSYQEIEHVEIRKKWWRIHDIVLRIGNPALVEEIPGVEMGKMVLKIDKRSREEAHRLTDYIDYKKSIFILDAQNQRIKALRESD